MSDRMDITAGPPDTVLKMRPPPQRLGWRPPSTRPSRAGARRWPMSPGPFRVGPTCGRNSGTLAGDEIEAYACYRVGYHRGLDALRQQGWRGSGYVRWSHPSNRGFLRCLDGLRVCAAAIGETAEEQRCEAFLHQLDPAWRLPR